MSTCVTSFYSVYPASIAAQGWFMTIHPTAVIHADAEIGDGVEVGAFSFIDRQVKIGDRCQIGPQATILAHTTLGAECQVHPGAVVGDLPQDFAFQKGTESYVQVGDRCIIREGVTIHRGTQAGSVTKVGDGCLLMANSHLAHNVQVGNGVVIANGALLAGYVEVGDRAFISGNCLLHQFTRVGRLAMMAGGSAIQRDLPPFCITRSLTTNAVLNLNIVGLRRAGFNPEDRLVLKRAFAVLYQSRLATPEALVILEQEFKSELVQELCQFVRSSKRGICKYFTRVRRSHQSLDPDEASSPEG